MISSTTKSRLLTTLRVLPATMLLAGALSFAPGAGATGCHAAPTNLSINGGVGRNTTNVTASADGGLAVSDASGGDDNLALAILGRANAGNGGDANANANGGRITLGDINSGTNTGNVLRVGSVQPKNCGAGSRVNINGGTSANTTNVTLSANGGIAVSDASGGDDNVAIGILGGARAGTGGTANANANGGTITLGDINSGGNVGNVISTGTLSGNANINGGTSSNTTNVNVSADGGLAVADASGGNGNVAVGVLGNAAAGNGGTAEANANGGTINVGDVNSGGNTGNVIETGNLSGNADINGGTSTNETNIDLSADGGVAVADASGGDDNVAVGLGGNANAGTGGTANSSANGGTINVGDVNSGGNTGNVIDVGN